MALSHHLGGERITKQEIQLATLPPKGNTRIGKLVEYAGSRGLRMESTRPELAHHLGGLEFAAVQADEGSYLLELDVTHPNGSVDPHMVAYLAGQPHDNGVGVILDNGGPVLIKGIQSKEREHTQCAREMFDSLFPDASSVRVVNVWRMTVAC